MAFALRNRDTGKFARWDCQGQHDGRFCDEYPDAAKFETFGEASDYSQNFDESWEIEE